MTAQFILIKRFFFKLKLFYFLFYLRQWHYLLMTYKLQWLWEHFVKVIS